MIAKIDGSAVDPRTIGTLSQRRPYPGDCQFELVLPAEAISVSGSKHADGGASEISHQKSREILGAIDAIIHGKLDQDSGPERYSFFLNHVSEVRYADRSVIIKGVASRVREDVKPQ